MLYAPLNMMNIFVSFCNIFNKLVLKITYDLLLSRTDNRNLYVDINIT